MVTLRQAQGRPLDLLMTELGLQDLFTVMGARPPYLDQDTYRSEKGAWPLLVYWYIAKVHAGLSLDGKGKTWFSLPSRNRDQIDLSLFRAPFPGALMV